MTKSARIWIFSLRADYSLASETRANVSPMIAMSMFKNVIYVMKVAAMKTIQGRVSPPSEP